MNKPEFVYAIHIRTTPEKLWEALTRGDWSEKYWGGYRLEAELKVGGAVRIVPPSHRDLFSDRAGKVLVCEPCRKLVYTWNCNDRKEVAGERESLTRVTYELTPQGSMVKLLLIHENLLPKDIEKDPGTLKGVNNGWPAVMSSLKSLLETGEAIPLTATCAQQAADAAAVKA